MAYWKTDWIIHLDMPVQVSGLIGSCFLCPGTWPPHLRKHLLVGTSFGSAPSPQASHSVPQSHFEHRGETG
jgi:hypothetical protein